MPIFASSAPETDATRINLAETADFDLGGLRVCPARCEVGMSGERRELQPKVAQVLVALAAARSSVVSRDRLNEQCWDGRIVGDDVLNRCIVALRHLAKDFSPEPFTIETVPRVGYCLVERPMVAIATDRSAWKARPKLAIFALLALILVVAALAFGWSRLDRGEDAPTSIAVLPFRNLSSGDPYFAQGIGEEILDQLARDPQFRVAGGTSSSQFGNDPDVREVARRLDVEYVLEGSVRRQGDRVRVNADMVQASDGSRLWSNSYDGKLDDIFAIQQRVGGAIASALRRKLVQTPALSGPLVTNGEAYNLYLTARGLLRTRNRRVGQTAASLLRDSINADPGYAPAWASLAEATQLDGALRGPEEYIATIPEAQRYARHALKLAPDNADAHRMLGMLSGYGTAESEAHLRRVAEIEPNRAESMLLLGVADGAVGEFDQELADYGRARELDPLWFRGVGALGMALAEMGNRAEAEALARRGFARDDNNRNILLGRIAWIFGDYSEAALRWSIVARANSPRWSEPARRNLNEARFAVGLKAEPLIAVPQPIDQRRRRRVWLDARPDPIVWQAHNRDPVAADVYRTDNHFAAKLMLNAGRARELVAAYDGAVGLLSLRRGLPLRIDQLGEVPVAALALRQVGRTAEADRLLREADAAVRAIYQRGQAPFWFDADAAAIWAVRGRTDDALSKLEQAMRRGWTHAGSTDLRDIVDEPAFRSLPGNPRFDRLRAKLKTGYARERRQIVQLGIQSQD